METNQTGSSLYERLQREILDSSAFDRLRSKYGSQFDEFIQKKIKPIAGDLTLMNLGITPELEKEIT